MNHFPYLGGKGFGNAGCKLTQEPTENTQEIRNPWNQNWLKHGLQSTKKAPDKLLHPPVFVSY